MKYVTEDEMLILASDYARHMERDAVLCLVGDLGSGKTAFVRMLCSKLGIEGTVSSPSFTILNIYEGATKIYHFDFYRLSAFEDLEEIGFFDIIEKPGIKIIEWPEIALDFLRDYNAKIIKFYFDEEQPDKRGILFE